MAPKVVEIDYDRLAASIKGVLGRDSTKHDEKLADALLENQGYRTENAELKGKLPKEGEVVLSKEDAESFTAYQEFGKPDEVKKHLEERTDLQGKFAEIEAIKLSTQAGSVAGWGGRMMHNLVQAKGLKLSIDVEGDEVKAAWVEDKDGKKHPVKEHVEKHYPDWIASLESTVEKRKVEIPGGRKGGRTEQSESLAKDMGNAIVGQYESPGDITKKEQTAN